MNNKKKTDELKISHKRMRKNYCESTTRQLNCEHLAFCFEAFLSNTQS